MRILTLVLLFAGPLFAQQDGLNNSSLDLEDETSPSAGSNLTLSAPAAQGASAKGGDLGNNGTTATPSAKSTENSDSLSAASVDNTEPTTQPLNQQPKGTNPKSPDDNTASDDSSLTSGSLAAASNNATNLTAASTADNLNSTDVLRNLTGASVDDPSAANRTGPAGKAPHSENGTMNGSSVDIRGNNDARAKGPANSKEAPLGARNCGNFCRRREVRNLSPGERSSFFSAVKKIMSGSSPTKYDSIVKWHIDAQQFAHSTAYFLPWHRAYLREFEVALQDVDSGLCVPYWNWSVDSQAPELSPIMSEDYYGGNGGTDGCVVNGNFNGWRPYYPQPHCLTRSYIYGDKLGAYHSFEGINRIVTSSSDYDTFRGRLETLAHPSVHNSVGGDISKMWSPNDPLFFAHHAYVDYIWTQWQGSRGKSFGGPGSNGRSATANDPLPFLGERKYVVNDVLSTNDLCYQYIDMDNSALGDMSLPSPTVERKLKSKLPDRVNVLKVPESEDRFSSKDRSNLNIVRFPDPASEEWLKSNGHDVSKVRTYESDYKSMYSNLNRIQGYISPCALWNRPSLTKRIIAAKNPVYADVVGYGRVEVDYSEDSDPIQAISNIKVKVQMCSPDVELPMDAYKSEVEKLVGKSAFSGAGTLKKVGDLSDMNSESKNSNKLGWIIALTIMMLTWHF